jgi:hypothetical protein
MIVEVFIRLAPFTGWKSQVPRRMRRQKVDLLVDIADTGSNKVLFRGYAAGAFQENPVKEDKLMSKAIDKMIKNFPPKQN